ncbi:MAG: alpha/beta hydrolase [Candidatus Thiodiazotropha sp.]
MSNELVIGRPVIGSLLLLFLSGCAGLPGASLEEVQGRKVDIAAKGAGSPVIVFESGMGPTMSTWAPIFDSLSKETRVFSYNRPGYGRSRAGSAPATAREIAQQLHQNLLDTGHNPPYLLVGHSAGGIYVNLFARLYPKEVSGVVLIDSTHPSQFEYFRKERPLLYSMFTTTTALGRTRYEASILKGVHNEFSTIEPFPEIPLIVLTAEKSSLFETREMREKWLEFQRDLAQMSSKAKHRVVGGSGHFIYRDKPGVVMEEITALIDQLRND